MMTWRRAERAIRCGFCGETLFFNDPVFVIEVHNVKRKFYRCGPCSGSIVPPDLPMHIERAKLTKPMTFLGDLFKKRFRRR